MSFSPHANPALRKRVLALDSRLQVVDSNGALELIDLDADPDSPLRSGQLVFGRVSPEPRWARLWSDGRVHHLISPDADSLILKAMLARCLGETIGPGAYLGPTTSRHRVKVGSSMQKGAACRELGRYAMVAGGNSRAVQCVERVAEELITNAIFNAPTNDQGQHIHAHKARDERVELEKGAVVELLADDDTFALCVSDSFGSLSEKIIFANLERAFRAEADQIDFKPGGAGLGFFTVLAAVSHLAITVMRGESTQVVALIGKRGSQRAQAQRGVSFDWWVDTSMYAVASPR